MNNNIYLCFHGHFYQPPRENPWTDEIESQSSASPFHDWNERIFQECYKPNTNAVIVDDNDVVLSRINNYEYFNFNFGPTLLHWIKKKHPKTLIKIINADKQSIDKHKGHGNAIAQVYNHIIMPLANKRDKITQVRWGLKDFAFHFGRESEAIWLAETACNNETLEVLIKEGIKYIILAPSQAHLVRKIGKTNWEDVSNNGINTKRPYRFFSNIDSNKYVDIFFYDGALSKNIAFDDYAVNPEKLINRIHSITAELTDKDHLICIATDGETFGHHKHFADRSIAYIFSELAPKKGYIIVNLGEYLSSHTPEYEVKIKDGKKGKGTSWSCAHGVDRWGKNCGCSDGGENGWNQKWRKPLRKSLNKLNKKLAKIFEENVSLYFKDVWKARNEYIDIILDPSEENKARFFYFNAKHYLNDEEISECIRLLEMQKYSMLMFTSCGWFFSDISGIETIKILEYASRAIEISKEFTSEALEEEFINGLSSAKSNKKEYKNGKEIYLKNVKKVLKV
ncbi:DUF3536 domain-containing protein [Bacteroidota bacterium]